MQQGLGRNFKKNPLFALIFSRDNNEEHGTKLKWPIRQREQRQNEDIRQNQKQANNFKADGSLKKITLEKVCSAWRIKGFRRTQKQPPCTFVNPLRRQKWAFYGHTQPEEKINLV